MKRALVTLALAVAWPPSFAAEPLGRLFYTPAQRAQMDAARSQKSRPPVASEQEQAASMPEVVTFDGVVRRSDGRTTVWINNRAINDGKAVGGVPLASRLRPDGSVNLGIAQSDRSVDLKVGQSVDIVSGTIAEPYNRPRSAAGKPAAAGANPGADKAPTDARAAAPTRTDADDNGPDAR